VPLLIGIDYEGGRVNRLHERYGFPATLSAAEIAASSTEDAHRYARTMAKTLKDTGINLNFAPVLDVNTNPVNPVIGQLGRSYSADIQKVIECAAIFAKAFHEEGILCAGKHFPGHGSSSGDTHAGFVDITQTWNQSELEPYIKLLHEPFGPPLVMTSHVVHYGLDTAGLPASLSTAITQDLLRGKLNFQGAVITDDMQMKAITVNAGADILVFGNQLSILNDPSEVIDIIHRAVIDGKIAESRINEAYQRVLRLKAQIKVKQGHSHSDSHFTSPNVNH
jgi:beta-N-acetylhexosaminidase